MRNTVIINLFSGPGCGKSTSAAQLFYELKKRNYDVELTNEYAKWLVYEENYKKIKNQLYLFSKQHNQIFRLNDVVDIVIMDSPLILSAIYDLDQSRELKDIILYEHNKFSNKNYFIERTTDYVQEGRYHNLEQAVEVDNKILNFLDTNSIPYDKVNLTNLIERIFTDLNIPYEINEKV